MNLTLDRIREAMARPEAKDPAPQERFLVRPADGSEREVFRPTEKHRPREAAVLALIYPRDGGLHILLQRRVKDLSMHAGQICFPGGGRDPGEESLRETMEREVREEVSLGPEDYEVVGELPPVFVAPTNYLVTPFVAVAEHPPRCRIDPAEVEKAIEVPLEPLLDPDSVVEEEWRLRGRRVIVPFFRAGGHKIWGATARMIAMLVHALA